MIINLADLKLGSGSHDTPEEGFTASAQADRGKALRRVRARRNEPRVTVVEVRERVTFIRKMLRSPSRTLREYSLFEGVLADIANDSTRNDAHLLAAEALKVNQ